MTGQKGQGIKRVTKPTTGTSASSAMERSKAAPPREGRALEDEMRQLSLQCSKGRDGIIPDIKMVQIG
ncbi:hypothetical protein E2I00_011651 [Balaenoptera physalus]|uniref:Uncharacterized protein n=1 Tax=Balaenoptera physalus TaxID=9770 RepID=A0A6A1QDH2_BALPH|nr:hypothetical protein E2I00_011651 [Balaenoptera physalus]